MTAREADTTNGAIAATCERLRKCRDAYIPLPNQPPLTRVLQVNAVPYPQNPDGAVAAATIEALQAERDAALGMAALERAATDMVRAEGAQQERAAIVAWLDNPTGAPFGKSPMYYAESIRRGEHLKGCEQ